MATRWLTALPVYDEAKYLNSVLNSVVRHSPNTLVVDDGSADETPQLLAARSDIQVVRHNRNRGYGAALMTKPQAILFVPVFVYIFLALRFMSGGTWRRALGLWKTAGVALVVVGFVAAPFMTSDARSDSNTEGAFRWFKRSYVGTIGEQRYDRTTLNAFNVWWFDLLAQGTPLVEDTPDNIKGHPKVREAYLGETAV